LPAFFTETDKYGLPLIECDTDQINPGDELEIDLDQGTLLNKTTGAVIAITPLPPVMLKILSEGGLVEHFKKYGTFHFD
jgi:3-isopropylmalate/(R)-2-methylmalate dehydratase small subunit